MLERIVQSAVDLADATYGALGVLDDTGTRLAQFITVGIDDEAHRAIGKLARGSRDPRAVDRGCQAPAAA